MTKTISFAIVHFSVAFGIGYLMTGSVMIGGAIAVVEPLVITVAYHIHERVWQHLGARDVKHDKNCFHDNSSDVLRV